jgi:alpha-L-fucosidase 2
MLLQSHAGEIALLPALPSAWPTGSISGLRARGAIGVDLHWRDGRATEVRLRPDVDSEQVIRPPRGQRIAAITVGDKRDEMQATPDGVMRMSLKAHNEYVITLAT